MITPPTYTLKAHVKNIIEILVYSYENITFVEYDINAQAAPNFGLVSAEYDYYFERTEPCKYKRILIFVIISLLLCYYYM